MFIVLLKLTDKRGQAGQFMAGHKAWIDRGVQDGVFLLTGSLQPNLGGAIMAHNTSLAALQDRMKEDPFVAEGIVSVDMFEFAPGRADQRLAFLLA
jgi:uncharacterized protein YciI